MLDLGLVIPGSTLYIPFDSFGSNGESTTITGLATTDIEIYKDGNMTQRASDAGYSLTDTDGIDLDTTTGIQGFEVDLSDNTTAGFYEAGSSYRIVVASVTINSQTVSFTAATFRIGYPTAVLNTSIATLSTQTNFTLTNGPAENDAINDMWAIVHDVASGVQWARVIVSDYVGATNTVTLAAAPSFTIAATDNFCLMGLAPLQPTTAGNQLGVASDGDISGNVDGNVVGSVASVTATVSADIVAISGDTPAANNLEADYDGTGYDKSASTIGTCTTNTDMRGTDNAALASVLGALNDVAAAGDPTNADTAMQYLKQLINILIGTTGVTTFPASAAPGNNVSLAEMLRAIYDDTDVIGTPAAASIAADIANVGTDAAAAATPSEVNTEVLDVLTVDTFAESSGVPAATATLLDKIVWLATVGRNKLNQTASQLAVRNDADTLNIATSATSDDTSTFIRDEFT